MSSFLRLLQDFHKYGVQVSLALFLLHEKLLGIESFWFPYLSSLPKTFTTPAFLPDRQLFTLPPLLKGTQTTLLIILLVNNASVDIHVCV